MLQAQDSPHIALWEVPQMGLFTEHADLGEGSWATERLPSSRALVREQTGDENICDLGSRPGACKARHSLRQVTAGGALREPLCHERLGRKGVQKRDDVGVPERMPVSDSSPETRVSRLLAAVGEIGVEDVGPPDLGERARVRLTAVLESASKLGVRRQPGRQRLSNRWTGT